MLMLKWIVITLAALAVVMAGLWAFGAQRWSERTRTLVQRLDAGQMAIAPARVDLARELEGLPAAVQRYFRTALTDGQPMVAAVRIEHRGTFNLDEKTERWVPFTSRQRVVTRRPGFVWDAQMPMMPGLVVRVHDAYVAGVGRLHAAVLGLVTVAQVQGGADVAHGELMRFVAEAAWYPTALLPSQGVQWQAVDDTSARATVKDGDVTLTLTFSFAADGTMAGVWADARGRRVGDRIEQAPWEGRWSDPQVRDGMRIPISGEVAWLLPEGRKVYWRGSITSVAYEFQR